MFKNVDHKTQLLYAVGVGLIVSDIVPTIADGAYFYYQRKNKEKLEKGEITAKQYWTRDVILYYGLNPIYWTLILGVSIAAGKTFEQKRNILIGMIAGGAVLGVLAKNVKKDTEFYNTHEMKLKTTGK